MTKEELARINGLAHKKKTEGLCAEEALEQKVLREKFLSEFRASFKAQLENIEIIDSEGKKTKIRRKKI